MTSENALNIQDVLTGMGVSMISEFVPFSKSRNSKNKDLSINWIVTIKRNNSSVSTDYMQGIGHLPEPIQPKYFGRETQENVMLQKHACETGKVGYFAPALNKIVTGTKPKLLNSPTIDEVLYCLILDASVIDYPSFADWAHDFGYNDDSMKDKAVYDECMVLALQMRHLFNDAEMNTLRKLFQDY